jgi:hypothetical protein
MESSKSSRMSLWSTARDYIGIVILLPVAFGLAAAITELGATKVYTSTTRLSVGQGPAESVLGVVQVAARQRLATELAVATAPETRAPVFSKIKDQVTLSASVDVETDILTLNATSRTPATARKAAVAYRESYAERSSARQRSIFDEAAKALSDEISLQRTAMLSLPTGSAERDRIDVRVQGLEDNRDLVLSQGRSVAGSRIRVLVPASLPAAPSNPPPYRKGLFGAILGSALSLAVLTVLDRRRASAVQPSDLSVSHPKLRLLGVPKRRSRGVDSSAFQFAAQVLAASDGLTGGEVVGVVVLGGSPKPFDATRLLADAIGTCGFTAIPVRSAPVAVGASTVVHGVNGVTFRPGRDDSQFEEREALRRLTEKMKGDITVVEGPNLTKGSGDAHVLRLADLIVLVIESGTVSSDELQVATQQLDALGVDVAGALFV